MTPRTRPLAPARLRLPALLCASALAAAPVAAQDAASFNWTDDLAAGAVLHVFTVNGEVTVARASGAAARVRGESRPDHRGRNDIRFEARRVDGGAVVCALYDEDSTCDEDGVDSRDGHRNRYGRGNLTVEVPEGVVLRVASGNGDVSVAGATADVHARSGNGSVRVGAGAARVEAASGNGEVTVEGARAGVRASSGNGGIRVSTEAGPVSATTGNGSIHARMATLRDAGDMEFRSGNGSITLELPADFSAEVSASTGHGEFDIDFPLQVRGSLSPTRLRGTIGGADRRLDVSTGNGSIRLRRSGA